MGGQHAPTYVVDAWLQLLQQAQQAVGILRVVPGALQREAITAGVAFLTLVNQLLEHWKVRSGHRALYVCGLVAVAHQNFQDELHMTNTWQAAHRQLHVLTWPQRFPSSTLRSCPAGAEPSSAATRVVAGSTPCAASSSLGWAVVCAPEVPHRCPVWQRRGLAPAQVGSTCTTHISPTAARVQPQRCHTSHLKLAGMHRQTSAQQSRSTGCIAASQLNITSCI